MPVPIEEEMKRSYIDYAMSVIVGRALPDVRDGLKPVHRRILYAMYELGLLHNRPYKKSARIVGEVLGKYHPHGDAAVYDALVRMVQDFSMRYPLIDGQGNFGSIDGDAAAAMRYTEARLAEIAEEMLADIEKETVDFVPNFDDSLKEPSVLPAKLPNLLINGSSGIAVGMATNIPPHNLGEVCDAIAMMIDNPDATLEELMQVIRGPDFPTGACILGRKGIVQAYTTGRGTLKLRGKAHIEEGRKAKIVITEIPYMVNKAKLIESIAELVRNKKIEGISDIRDESDREGMRIVVELRKGAQAKVVLNQLYKHTQLETSFGVINLVLVDGEPKVLSLQETIREFIKHRTQVVRRRSEYELKQAEKRAHVLEGLLVALKNIDEVIKIIRGSPGVKEAKERLMSRFSLTEVQAQAILDMRLQKLAKLEREKLRKEHEELKRRIEELRELLGSEEKILQVVKRETLELKEKYGDARRTEILSDEGELEMEDLIAKEDMVVTITQNGYIKRLPARTYRNQRRGGRGIVGVEAGEDRVRDVYVASSHDYMLFFSSSGKVYWRRVYEIPEAGRYSKGKAMVNLLGEAEGERITATLAVSEFCDECFLVFATRQGKVKKTPLSAFGNPRRAGIIAITLAEGDELVEVEMAEQGDELMLATKFGKAIRFSEGDVRAMGRNAMGVTGITLRRGDEVVAMEVLRGETVLTVTENGYGKRTSVSEYPLQRRGGKGVINILPTPRNGTVVSILCVDEEDEVVLTSAKGVVIRLRVSEVPVMGRSTQGVRLMRLEEDDRVVGVAKVVEDDSDEGGGEAAPSASAGAGRREG
ncbi:MAG: DNA gyrase subunit A [Euryarchaeota archaeon]|nr:DNA gyrase subunit A [Euryarchaeota archaeon]